LEKKVLAWNNSSKWKNEFGRMLLSYTVLGYPRYLSSIIVSPIIVLAMGL